jgi:hypothetical protein
MSLSSSSVRLGPLDDGCSGDSNLKVGGHMVLELRIGEVAMLSRRGHRCTDSGSCKSETGLSRWEGSIGDEKIECRKVGSRGGTYTQGRVRPQCYQRSHEILPVNGMFELQGNSA